MRVMRHYPLDQRREILAAYDSGETAESLQKRLGVSRHSLREWLRLRAETGDAVPRPHGGGAHPALSADERKLLVELREQDPEASHPDLVARLAERGIHVSVPTVGRYLRAAGFVRHAVKISAKAKLSSPEGRSNVRRYRRGAAPPAQGHRQAYPSDVTDAEWVILDPLVPTAKPGGRPETHSRREIVNAIFYVLRSGCQWRMLPHDFPPWETVYDDFRRWRNDGVWEEINHVLREKLRHRSGREKSPTAVIIDSQSVKTTERGGPVAMMGPNA